MSSKSRGGRQSSDSRYKKEEVADKVREIKMRQQNWMKQREEHKNKDDSWSLKEDHRKDTTQNSKPTSVSSKTTLSRTQSADGRMNTQTLNLNTSNKTTGNKTQVNPRGKFQNWLQTRDTNTGYHGNPEYDPDESKPSTSSISRSVPRGMSAPALYKNDRNLGHPGYQFLKDDQMSDDETSEEIRSRLLAPKDFDALADRIVSRAQLDVGRNGQHLVTDNSDRERRVVSAFSDAEESSSNMRSHHCACCTEIMIDSQHTPMLLIPCGHTVCRACCQGRELCPDCYCSIGSTTCNIMLQQIIQEYQGKKTAKISPSRTFRKDDQYRPQNYQENRKTASASNRNQYKEQLQNLKTRLEILQSEKSTAKQECDQLSDAIQQEAHQVRNISKQEDNICSQIKSLEEKLSILRQHKGEYEGRLEELKCEREESQKRLAMLRDTMETLGNELEKVKLLSEA